MIAKKRNADYDAVARKKDQGVAFLRRLGKQDAADALEDEAVDDYAQRKGILLENPKGGPCRRVRPGEKLTDRGKRHRAERCYGRRENRCLACGRPRPRTDIGHVNGNESDGTRSNLLEMCRPCNAKAGAVLNRAGIGIKTKQFNPSPSDGARSLGQWVKAVMAVTGQGNEIPLRDAIAMVRATPAAARSRFAKEVWKIRRQRSKNPKPVPIPSERGQVEAGFYDWLSRKAYLAGGNYRVRLNNAGIRGQHSKIAPWNKAVKRAYPKNEDFHRAAEEWARRTGKWNVERNGRLTRIARKLTKVAGFISGVAKARRRRKSAKSRLRRLRSGGSTVSRSSAVPTRSSAATAHRGASSGVVADVIASLRGLGYSKGDSESAAAEARRDAGGSGINDFDRLLRAAMSAAARRRGRTNPMKEQTSAKRAASRRTNGETWRQFTELGKCQECKREMYVCPNCGKCLQHHYPMGKVSDLYSPRNTHIPCSAALDKRKKKKNIAPLLAAAGEYLAGRAVEKIARKVAKKLGHKRGHRELERTAGDIARKHARRKLSNPEGDAQDLAKARKLYKQFIGADATKLTTLRQQILVRENVTKLGDLTKLELIAGEEDDHGNARLAKINFEGGGVTVCSNPEGTQLYFLGGDQNLGALLPRLEVDRGKELLDLGEVYKLWYFAKKAMTNFDPVYWHHELGEEGGARPRLMYDQLNRQMHLVGGDYQVRPEGITN